MLEKYQNWVVGFKILGFIALVAIGPATAMAAIMGVLITIVFMFINPDYDLTGHYKNILLLSLLAFSPYYVGKLWHLIQDLEKSLREDH